MYSSEDSGADYKYNASEAIDNATLIGATAQQRTMI